MRQCWSRNTVVEGGGMLKKIVFKKRTGLQGLHHSSVGKESACNAGYPGSIPGPRRSAGEGIGY